MKKVVIQLSILVAILSGTWYGLSLINWVGVFQIKKISDSTEEKLGNLFWEMYSKAEKEITDESITSTIDTLVYRVCKANDIDIKKIKLHIFEKDEVNAFALPDNHLVIYSGLILACENEAELLGVLCHELAHIEKNHVMKKLVKEVGLNALISITTGAAGGEILKETARLLSSSAYDRKLETEADLTAVEYLTKTNIDAEQFANFLYRLSDEALDIPNQLYWVSTHPQSKERAKAIVGALKNKKVKQTNILSNTQWKALKIKLTSEKEGI